MHSARRRSTGLAEEAGVTSCRLLVSVRNAEEARAAIGGGVGIVDVKDPARGPLGRADDAAALEICETVARLTPRGRVIPVSVALGELLEHEEHSGLPLPAAVALFKAGLSGCAREVDWRSRLDRMRARLGGGESAASLVAVAYADFERAFSPEPMDVLQYALSAGLEYFLVDTFEKGSGTLRTFLTQHQLTEILRLAHLRGLKVAFAGSLRTEHIPELVKLGADVIAVRGAACRGADRDDAVETDRVAELVGLLNRACRPG